MAVQDKHLIRAMLLCLLGIILTVFASVFFSGCASSRFGKGLDVGVGVSAGLDFVTTRRAINSGRGHEANSIVGNGAIRQALVKALGSSFVIGSAAYLEKKEQKVLAQVIRGLAIVGWSAVSAHNFQIARAK